MKHFSHQVSTHLSMKDPIKTMLFFAIHLE